ncbi:MFS transporter [Corynebacterium yudongzhengii]|uniref:MFS transporter n=1 Tax=Corynebacterium yudongzhengii TaxID=2080740 RepID=A0A2U1T6G8_9CORY|nr:MFS transporter [Corynebacterium yudongzhengii]AWB81612.1 MFS transporter [Corynebacterium yudongzhengii]PWC01597.1 MFS transporter [Corynebacterium yudongzhengii]
MAQSVLSRQEIEKLDSIWKAPGFTPTLVAVASAFGAWSLLLPVVPLAVIESGGSSTLAGASTGIFMLATVLTQIVTPWMLRTFGYNPVMVVSAFMLGVPALGHLLGDDAWIVLLFSALRGVGFGAITVAESALIAELVPVRFLGKATGMLGVFIGLSQMVFLAAGVFMADLAGFGSVYITAAIVALIGAAMCLRIPRIKAASVRDQTPDPHEPPRASMWKLVLVPALALTTLSMSFGAVSSFLPAAVRELDPATGAIIGGFMLSFIGGASMVARYVAGIIADRRGEPGSLMVYSQLTGLVGVGLMAATLYFELSVWLLVIAALLFGASFGAVQNESLLSMFHRLPRSRVSEASAVWNIFYDSGTGLGSVVYGALVTGTMFAGAFGAGAAVIAVGIAMTVADLILGRNRVTEFDNIRTRLQRVRTSAARRVPRRLGVRQGAARRVAKSKRKRTRLHEQKFPPHTPRDDDRA